MDVFSSCAVLDTRIFFIMLARCASTVLTLILSRWPISLFMKPAQISWRICCSRLVRDSGRLFLGGGVRLTKEDLDLVLAIRAILYTPLRQSAPTYRTNQLGSSLSHIKSLRLLALLARLYAVGREHLGLQTGAFPRSLHSLLGETIRKSMTGIRQQMQCFINECEKECERFLAFAHQNGGLTDEECQTLLCYAHKLTTHISNSWEAPTHPAEPHRPTRG